MLSLSRDNEAWCSLIFLWEVFPEVNSFIFGFPLYCLSQSLSPPSPVHLWSWESDCITENVWVWKDAYFLFPTSCDLSLQFGNALQGQSCTQCQCHCWSRSLAIVWGWLGGSWGQTAEWQDLWMCAGMPCRREVWMWDTSLYVEKRLLWSLLLLHPTKHVLAASQTLLLPFFTGLWGMFWVHSQEFTIYIYFINSVYILGKVWVFHLSCHFEY